MPITGRLRVRWIERLLYRAGMMVGRGYMKLFVDLRVWGRENIPVGAKIYVQNHITANDPCFVLPIIPDCVHVVVGPGYNIRPLAWVLGRFEQINAMPDHRATVVDHAVKYLEAGEAVYTAPEGDLQELFQLGRFYPGVARMYRRCRAPIIPIALVAPKRHAHDYPWMENELDGRVYRAYYMFRGTYCINIGKPFYPEIRADVDEKEDNRRITAELEQRMQKLIDEVRHDKFWLE